MHKSGQKQNNYPIFQCKLYQRKLHVQSEYCCMYNVEEHVFNSLCEGHMVGEVIMQSGCRNIGQWCRHLTAKLLESISKCQAQRQDVRDIQSLCHQVSAWHHRIRKKHTNRSFRVYGTVGDEELTRTVTLWLRSTSASMITHMLCQWLYSPGNTKTLPA